MSKWRQLNWHFAYMDFLAAFCAVAWALLIMAAAQVNPSEKNANSERNAEIMVTTNWTDGLCDVDLAVKDPTGAVTWYQDKVKGLAHLEFDDRGNVNSSGTTVDGATVLANDHHEYWVIRGIIPGTYHTSLHLFTCRGKGGDPNEVWPHGTVKDIKATISVQDLNPQLVVADTRELTMHKVWDEVPGPDFNVAADGSINNVDDGAETLIVPLIAAKEKASQSIPYGYSGHY